MTETSDVASLAKAAISLWRSSSNVPPEQFAALLAIGFVLGVFPIPGIPTLLCVAAALALRLNFPAMEIVNQLTTPAQIALLVPNARIGARLIGSDLGLGGVMAHAVVGWLCLCVPIGFLIYLAALLLLRRTVAAG